MMGVLAMRAGLRRIGPFTGILAGVFETESRRYGFLEARALLSHVPFLDVLGCGVVGYMARRTVDVHTIADRDPDLGQAIETEAATRTSQNIR